MFMLDKFCLLFVYLLVVWLWVRVNVYLGISVNNNGY